MYKNKIGGGKREFIEISGGERLEKEMLFRGGFWESGIVRVRGGNGDMGRGEIVVYV